MQIHWDEEKNKQLRSTRGLGFEDVESVMNYGDKVRISPHFNKEKYPHQLILIFEFKDYIYYAPFVKNGDVIFLKTIIPSRKLTKEYFNNNLKLGQ